MRTEGDDRSDAFAPVMAIPLGSACGLLLGIVLGTVIGNVPLGIGVGLAGGLCMGGLGYALFERHGERQDSD